MLPLRTEEIAALSGGRLDGVAADAVVSGPVVVDSRLAGPGALFVALAGEHEDGHRYVGDAIRRGAVLAMTARPVDEPAVVVDDVEKALGYIAGGLLRRTPGVRVCGVTGSSGKTSTKDLMAAVLRSRGPTVSARGSFNNEIGLPLTVLDVDDDTAHLVLEYSARGVGHIAYLAGIARPQVAVVLNVGSAHLGEFGSREAIAAAKGELIEALPPDGTAVLNADDPLVASMSARTDARVVGFGESGSASIRISDVELDEQVRAGFVLTTPDGQVRIRLAVHGRHQVHNAAAAAAVGLAVGMTLPDIAEALGSASAQSAHRMAVQRRADGLLVVDDAYNANPESVRAALESLVQLARGRGGRSWAVLGEMLELGDSSDELHRATGHMAAALGVDHLVVLGDTAAAIGEGAQSDRSWSGTCLRVASIEDALAALGEAHPADVVLVKASNAIGLWRLAEQLVGGGAA